MSLTVGMMVVWASSGAGRRRDRAGSLGVVLQSAVAGGVVLIALASVLVGCDGDDGTSVDESPTPAAVSIASESVTSASTSPTPSSTTTTSTTTATSAPPVAEGLLAELEIVGEPDFLAADEHGVWVRLAIGQVALIDPSTNEVVDRIEVQTTGFPCDGLGAGAGAIWACTDTELVRIDPRARQVTWSAPISKAALQGRFVVAEDQVWVLEGDGSTLAGLDVATGEVRSRFDLPARGTDVGYGEAGLWVVSSVDDAVLHVDPLTGSILAEVAVNAPIDVGVDREVWIGANQETVRIDTETDAVDLSVPVGTGSTGGIALAPREAWVRNADDTLTRIDRETGEIVEQYTSVLAGGDVVYAFESVWTSAFDDSTVFRFAAPL